MEPQEIKLQNQPTRQIEISRQKPLTYTNLSQFISKTRQLLKQQQKYQIELFNDMTQNKTIQQIQQQGCGLSNMLIIGQREGFYGKIILTLIKAYHSQKNPIVLPEQCKLQVGDNVAIMKNNTIIASGTVYKRAGPKIKISIRQQQRQQQQYQYEGVNCHLVLTWNEVTFRRYFNVLQELEQHTIYKQSQLVNRLFPDQHEVKFKREKKNLPGQQELQIPKMNDEQVEAIKMGLKEQVHLVHGPPGTGKTTTICELIFQAVKKGQKVLACAPSNIAVDNMVESLGNRVKCVRIGNPARVIEKVLEHCLDYLITKNTNLWKNQVKKLQATRKRLSKCTSRQQKKKLYFEIKQFQSEIHLLQQQTIQQILNEADVICSTNVGAADRSFKKYLSKRKFDLVVIDECGQGLEVSCWIPLLKGKRAVLAGDHKQLPPTIKGKENSLLSYTLFSRAMDQLSNITSTMLLVQYRMNKLIMGWSNKMFYQDKLIAHDSVKDHLLKQLYQNVQENEEVIMMIDTAGCKMGENGQQTESKMNVGQADIAISVYRKIIKYGVQSKHIAILTPYSKQVALIKSLILQQNLPAVDVSTVDGIQGRQKQCIIISMVRSNKKKQIGFLKDWRRMNVAVTRARRMLVLIGNTDCVSHDKFIGTLVKWIEENGKMVSGLQFEGDPLVRFGEGVADQEDYAKNDSNNNNAESQQAKKKKNDNNKKKKKKEGDEKDKGMQNNNKAIQKPSIYQAHTQEQIQSLKQYYHSILSNITDPAIFPGATNFQRKLIHQVATQLNLNHETSADKKQIRVWIKPQPVIIQIPQQQQMIEIKGKNRNRLYQQKQQIQNEKLLQSKIDENKLIIKHNVGKGKFGDGLQSLIGKQQSSSDDQYQKQKQQLNQQKLQRQKQKMQQKQQQTMASKKKKNNKKSKKSKQQQTTQGQMTQQQQLQQLQKTLKQFENTNSKPDQCHKCQRKITSVTSVKCRFCLINYCRSHVLAQEHGCDQAARDEGRSNRRQVDKLVQKGAEKIKQKIKQQQEARKRKSTKGDKNSNNK